MLRHSMKHLQWNGQCNAITILTAVSFKWERNYVVPEYLMNLKYFPGCFCEQRTMFLIVFTMSITSGIHVVCNLWLLHTHTDTHMTAAHTHSVFHQVCAINAGWTTKCSFLHQNRAWIGSGERLSQGLTKTLYVLGGWKHFGLVAD